MANHAYKALEIDEQTSVDVLVTDLNMPDINGQELIHRLRAKRPNLPVVVLTGRPPTGGLTALNGDAPAPTALLRKPATSADISRAIESVLA